MKAIVKERVKEGAFRKGGLFCVLGAVVLPVLFALGGCGGSGGSGGAAPDDVSRLEDAYIFSYPLVIMSATQKEATNTVEATERKAPPNQLHHAQRLTTPNFTSVVTPNVDTLYSPAFIDLKDGPLVFVKPAAADRYCSAQFLDAWTDCVGIAGSGGSERKEDSAGEQVCLLMRADDTATVVPEGMRVFRFSGDLGWIIGRTLCRGEADLENVRAVQKRMRLLPLKAYLAGGDYTPPQGTHDPRYDGMIPVAYVREMTPEAFFCEANALMRDNPPSAQDEVMLARIRGLGVGPGLSFDASPLGADAQSRDAAWRAMLERVGKRVAENSRKFQVSWGPWQYLGAPIAEFGTEYDYRAMIAQRGLGANPVRAAIYASANRDSSGQPLKAGARYRVRFEKGALPPVREDGFWSVTAYNDDDFLIANPLNRFSVNDRSSVVYNEDGSLELLLQPEPPRDDDPLKANWLPTGQGGFHLFLRLYCPNMDEIDGGWKAPAIVAAKSE